MYRWIFGHQGDPSENVLERRFLFIQSSTKRDYYLQHLNAFRSSFVDDWTFLWSPVRTVVDACSRCGDFFAPKIRRIPGASNGSCHCEASCATVWCSASHENPTKPTGGACVLFCQSESAFEITSSGSQLDSKILTSKLMSNSILSGTGKYESY